jgi:gluconate kinase
MHNPTIKKKECPFHKFVNKTVSKTEETVACSVLKYSSRDSYRNNNKNNFFNYKARSDGQFHGGL